MSNIWLSNKIQYFSSWTYWYRNILIILDWIWLNFNMSENTDLLYLFKKSTCISIWLLRIWPGFICAVATRCSCKFGSFIRFTNNCLWTEFAHARSVNLHGRPFLVQGLVSWPLHSDPKFRILVGNCLGKVIFFSIW